MEKYHNLRAFQLELWQNCDNGCSWCVPAGSTVILSNYTRKNIEDVQTGDVVLTYDSTNKVVIPTKVLNTSKRYIEEPIYHLEVDGKTLDITKDHPILTESNKWLTPKDIYTKKERVCYIDVSSKDKYVKIHHNTIDIEPINFTGYVYNIQTEAESYIVNDIVVHNCYLNGNRILSSNSDKINNINKSIELIRSLDSSYDAIGIIGGELFGNQLSDDFNVLNAFVKLIRVLDNRVICGKTKQVWITASLLSDRQVADLLYCSNFIHNRDKFIICTSYDTTGRFHTDKQKEEWFHNIQLIRSLNYNVHTQVILTSSFIDEALSTDILNRISKYSMIDFKSPTIHRDDYLKVCNKGANYRDLVNELKHKFDNSFFICDRNKFMKFLLKIKDIFGEEKVAAYCSNEVRSDTLVLLSNGITLDNRWVGGIENAPCGHPWDSYCYSDSDKCSRCDAEELLSD